MFRFRGGRNVTSSVVEVDPAVGRLDEPGDHPQRRRLAAARRPEQRDELAVGDLEVELVDGDRLAVALRDRGRIGRSPSEDVGPLEVARAEDPEEHEDGRERDRAASSRRGPPSSATARRSSDEVEDPERRGLDVERVDEQRDEVLVEDDDEAQQQPGARRPARSAGTRSSGRSASRSRRGTRRPPRTRAAGPSAPRRSASASTGTSRPPSPARAPTSTWSWYVKCRSSRSDRPMTAPGTYSDSCRIEKMHPLARERVADDRVGRRAG